MKRSNHSVLLAGLLAMTLGACTTTGMQGDATASAGSTATTDDHYGTPPASASGAATAANAADASNAGNAANAAAADARSTAGTGMDGTGAATAATGTSASGTSATGTSATGTSASGTSASDRPADAAQGTQADPMAGISNSTVSNIELVPRQGGDAATGAGTVAGAAVGGTTGAASSTDRVYRITLRMDDGTVRTITQETTPAFSTGDRVRLANDAIVR